MFCTQCGVELGAKDRFCSQCAHPTELAVQGAPEQTRLTRDMRNKKIAGVCAGFARYLAVDVILVRVIWLVLAFGTGIGFIAYIVAWIVMPKEPIAVTAPANQYSPQSAH
jgi:phage shock protein C